MSKYVHCFRTACHTYASVIEQVQRPGTDLHNHWSRLPAPEVAISYWKLPKDASFLDTLRCMVRHLQLYLIDFL